MLIADDVPAGVLPAFYYQQKGNVVPPRSFADSLLVVSGGTVSTVCPPRLLSKKIYLNTTLSGAGIAATITGFPVLIRLTNNNFNFSEAKKNGEDVRFAASGNAPLPYEIERWDSAAQRAEVWVKVDTVFGDDSSHFITMYWGNPNAVAISDGAAVFDTANGFQGVWHMGQAGNATAFDATANHYDGTPSGMIAASAVEGVIGVAQQFDGSTSYITLAGTASSKLSFPENGTYTLSAWVFANTLDGQAHYIISKGNRNYNLDLSATNQWEIYNYLDTKGWISNLFTAIAGIWHYITGVRNGTNMRLYVDGACVNSTADTTVSSTGRDTTSDIQIGKRSENTSYGFWNGAIDDACIANVPRSADWIKLCYMNQNIVDRLIVFR